MRVISGLARGTKLICPDDFSVRPTHDRVREALFSMLTGRTQDAAVLDLFAGSGALGIEALSRGAKHATFVDVSKQSLAAVESNVNKTRFTEKATLVNLDFKSFLQQTDKTFDLIFLDPPYQADFLLPALQLIKERTLLAEGGMIFCEMEGTPPEEIASLYEVYRNKKYGRAQILLLKEMAL